MVAACGACFSGCVSRDVTVVRDTERRKVEFENDAAARIFYEALSQNPNIGSHAESTTKIDIPVVFEHKRHVVTGPNSAFNQAVTICDSNQDGRITELEAKIFAEQRQKK